MSTIKDKLYFKYAGVDSRSFGLISVVLDSGMFEETYVASREVEETRIPNRIKPFFRKFNEEKLTFELVLAFEKQFTDTDLKNIQKWLFQDYYQPLVFENHQNKIFNCVAVGDSSIVHNGLQEGYITVTMECDGPRVYGEPHHLTFSKGTRPTFTIENDGDDEVPLFISMANTDAGTFQFNRVFDDIDSYNVKVNNIQFNENIIVRSDYEQFETDRPDIFHYDDITGDLSKLSIKKGINSYTFTGNADYDIYYQLTYKW